MFERKSFPVWAFVSVGLNLFLAGALVGVWFSSRRHMPPPPRPPLQMMVDEASGKLSPDGLRKLSDLAAELERRFRSEMANSESLRNNIQAQLGKEPFDVAAFTKALDDLNMAFAQNRRDANRRFADIVAALSPEDRRQLAQVRFR